MVSIITIPAITPEWILAHFSEVIILKDFDVDLVDLGISVRPLPTRTLASFDVGMLKTDIYSANKNATTIPEAVLTILLNSNVRRGSLARIEQFAPLFLDKIKYFVDNNLPIEIVLPSLPHKKQSPITTGHSIDFVDLGDYLCVLQLKNIILSIKNIYAPGAHITILPDGITLAHLFARNDLQGARRYTQKLLNVLEEFDVSGDITVKDLNDLFLAEEGFGTLRSEIKRYLTSLAGSDATVSMGMNILQKAMLFNVPFDHSIEEHMQIMRMSPQEMPRSMKEKLEFAAFEYATILLAMKRTQMIAKAFPDALRASVHSKPTANLPLNLINPTSLIFPYNGVPVVRTRKLGVNGNIRKATRIMRLYEVYKYPVATAVYREGDTEPFWYEIDSLTSA